VVVGLVAGCVVGSSGVIIICRQISSASAAIGVATSGSSSRPSVNEFAHEPSSRCRASNSSASVTATSTDLSFTSHCRHASR
jgi:hypothetical protein